MTLLSSSVGYPPPSTPLPSSPPIVALAALITDYPEFHLPELTMPEPKPQRFALSSDEEDGSPGMPQTPILLQTTTPALRVFRRPSRLANEAIENYPEVPEAREKCLRFTRMRREKYPGPNSWAATSPAALQLEIS